MPNAIIPPPFTYASIEPASADMAKAAAERIRASLDRQLDHVVAIGRELIQVKEALGHGRFLPWLDAEFGMSHATASNFMNVAEKFGDKFLTIRNLPQTTIYALASSQTPAELRAKVIEHAEAGEPLSKAAVDELLRDERHRRNLAAIEAGKSAKQRAREKRERENHSKRQEELRVERAAREAREVEATHKALELARSAMQAQFEDFIRLLEAGNLDLFLALSVKNRSQRVEDIIRSFGADSAIAGARR